MGFGPRASLAAILGFAAAFAVACGSSGNGLLSSAQSSSIAAQLTAVQAAVDAGHCARAASASHKLTDVISGLPSGVDQKLFANLGQGAATVAQLAAKDCGKKTQSTSTPTVTSTTPTQSSTTATQATSTTQSTPATTATSPQTTSSSPQTQTGGGTGTAQNTTTQGGGAPVGGGTKTSGG
jgi:hypothetical protein